LPDAGVDALGAALEAACEGRTSLAELRALDWCAGIVARLTPEQQRLLREQAPERVALPGGRSVVVHYERGKPPWIESRLQDFFGMQAGPSVCKRRVPVLHLLSNRRAVQVTTDLAGFWQRHYPPCGARADASLPKHAWPEDGATACRRPRARR
jgi:ATP-dependent helicase HrpB